MAQVLHRSDPGRLMQWLLFQRVVPKLEAEIGRGFKVDLCSTREADSMVQNSDFLFSAVRLRGGRRISMFCVDARIGRGD
jgi:hypothetical protein